MRELKFNLEVEGEKSKTSFWNRVMDTIMVRSSDDAPFIFIFYARTIHHCTKFE